VCAIFFQQDNLTEKFMLDSLPMRGGPRKGTAIAVMNKYGWELKAPAF